MAPFIIYPNHIQKVYNCSPSTASRKMHLMKAAYRKKRHQSITLKEFCNYFDLPIKETTEFLIKA
jgi:hypothetical protein